MKKTKKTLAVLLALMLCLSLLTVGGFAAEPAEGDIVILYTNDVHNVTASGTGVPTLTPYAKLAAIKAEMAEVVGAGNVTLVDAGDSVQGEAIGSLTRGGYLVEIMNEVGYDVVTFGNHEFDFGIERMQELMELHNAKVVNANLVDLATGEAVYDAYTIIEYGDIKVAYVGMITPETFVKSDPTNFQNEDGGYIFGFNEGNNGQDLYDAVQGAVDAAIAEGADYVIAIGHLGVDEISAPWRSTDVIANTTGIDAFIDGHSHSVIAGDKVENKDGEEVLLTQTGTKLANVGQLVIAADGTISSSLIDLAEYENEDEEIKAYLDAITELFTGELEAIIGQSDVALTVNDPATGLRMVRDRETNLGNLCADAYRVVLGADIGWVNGGGIRASVPAGDITYGQVISVHPFGNVGVVVEATGQQIIDALEMSVRAAPGEFGGFLQVSGIEFSVDLSIKSTVVVDEKNMFVEVAGARRVKNVKVGGEDIDLEATYSLASHNFMLLNGGDGINMFVDNEVILLSSLLDNQILIAYISEYLDGVVGEDYANPYGQGRINQVASDWADERVQQAIALGLVPDSIRYAGWQRPATRVAAAEAMMLLMETLLDFDMYAFAEAEGWDLSENQFTDTKSPVVTFLKYAGVVRGVDDDGTLFAPNGAYIRAHVVTLLGQALEAFTDFSVEGENPFTDVPDYAVPYVGFAAELGIVQGIGDGLFDSYTAMTNEGVAILSLNVFNLITTLVTVPVS